MRVVALILAGVLLSSASFAQIAPTNRNSPYTYKLEKTILQQIDVMHELENEFLIDGLQLPLLFIPESNAFDMIGEALNFCREMFHGAHIALTPSLIGKIQQYHAIQNEVKFEISALHVHSTQGEADRFLHTPEMERYFHGQETLRRQAQSVDRSCSSDRNDRRKLPYCPPPTGCRGGSPRECEAENTRQTHEYAECQRRNGYSSGVRQ
jgi:hypothetical protein